MTPVCDLDREDGETIDIDFDDLYSLYTSDPQLEAQLCSEAETFCSSSAVPDYGAQSAAQFCSSPEPRPVFREQSHCSEAVLQQYCSATSDMVNTPATPSTEVIDASLEIIRSAIASANLPPGNRDLIEKSITSLRNAIELPGPEVRQQSGAVEAEQACAGEEQQNPASLTAAAEHEDRVREALGIRKQVSGTYTDHRTVFPMLSAEQC